MIEMNDGGERISFGEGAAIREPVTGKGRPELITPYGLLRLAKWYEKGAEKYEDDNWTKGMPFRRYTGAIGRHLIAWMMGKIDEDHLAAIAWNAMAIMHHQEMGEGDKWDDMPKYEKRKKNSE